MNFREVAAPFVAAFVIAVVIWATIGPSRVEHSGSKDHYARAAP